MKTEHEFTETKKKNHETLDPALRNCPSRSQTFFQHKHKKIYIYQLKLQKLRRRYIQGTVTLLYANPRSESHKTFIFKHQQKTR